MQTSETRYGLFTAQSSFIANVFFEPQAKYSTASHFITNFTTLTTRYFLMTSHCCCLLKVLPTIITLKATYFSHTIGYSPIQNLGCPFGMLILYQLNLIVFVTF